MVLYDLGFAAKKRIKALTSSALFFLPHDVSCDYVEKLFYSIRAKWSISERKNGQAKFFYMVA